MTAVIEDLKRTVFRVDGTAPLYGGPSMGEVVDDVNTATALFRRSDDGHCIWEIVLHAAYWRHEDRIRPDRWRRLDTRPTRHRPDRP